MLMTNGGGIDEYFANISELRLPKDQERLGEISTYYVTTTCQRRDRLA